MQLALYQVDAFAERVFTGNPAAVCPLEGWLPDAILQAIAEENNLAETAFFVPSRDPEADYHLRWFTPVNEENLCGHATLASAYVLFTQLGYAKPSIRFQTRTGILVVTQAGDQRMSMLFPALPPIPCETPQALIAGLGRTPLATLRAMDYIAVFALEQDIQDLAPDWGALARLDLRGVVATAPASQGGDFVSRFFAPNSGIPEDPVTGSAHCELAPYWAGRCGKASLVGRQLSRRGGTVQCSSLGKTVELVGRSVLYMRAMIEVPD